MKYDRVKVLDEKDHIFVRSLGNLGVSRCEAMAMAYLMNVDEASSHEIETSTGLRQPEVSLAMKSMHVQSWITVRFERKQGKGRPIKIYSLVVPIDVIMNYYENEINEKHQSTIMVIEKARTMSSRYSPRRN